MNIVDNIMKPLKGAISAAANKAGRAVAKAIGKKASKTARAAAEKATAKAEKSGDFIRKRLAQKRPPQRRRDAKMSKNEVKTLINNLIPRS